MFKKVIPCILIVLILLLCISSCNGESRNVSDKVIRFHVIANSDSADDQALKLRVRNEVLNDIGPKLVSSNSKIESEQIIKDNLDEIKSAALKEISRSGENYDVAVSLGKSNFPTKQYSDIVLPAGEYDALRVVIGKGEGKNWWCVMFPPLCFIDITRGITSEETENQLKSILSDDEYDSIMVGLPADNNSSAVKKPIESEGSVKVNSSGKSSENVEIKFKSAELFQSLIDKIRALFGI